jgi:hypothetical protein
MPRISEFDGMIIRMYWRDHMPPHFHVDYNGNDVVVGIDPARIMQGTLPGRLQRRLLQWTQSRRQQLLDNWQKAQQRLELEWIDPL